MTRLQLFCLPYAGGSANYYYDFRQFIHQSIEVIPIEYKGHGRRLREEAYHNMSELVNDVCEEIRKRRIKNIPYALLGYSLGSLVSYEAAYRFENSTGSRPSHIFLLAKTPPDDKVIDISHLLDNESLVNHLLQLGGIPRELHREKELMDLFIPIIKNDLKIYNEYRYDRKSLSTNISVIYSAEDTAWDKIYRWRNFTTGQCSFFRFTGNHFFINNNLKGVVETINHVCSSYCSCEN